MNTNGTLLQVSSPSSASASEVLETGELLTLIMSHLDIRTLLPSQRVSKAWRTAFYKSSLLQTRAMLQPTNKQAKKYRSPDCRGGWNPSIHNMVLRSDDPTDGVYWICRGIGPGRCVKMVQHRPSTSRSCYCHVSTKPRSTAGSWQSALLSNTSDHINIEATLEDERGRIRGRHLNIGMSGSSITIADMIYMLERWAAGRLHIDWTDKAYINGIVRHDGGCANNSDRILT